MTKNKEWLGKFRKGKYGHFFSSYAMYSVIRNFSWGLFLGIVKIVSKDTLLKLEKLTCYL